MERNLSNDEAIKKFKKLVNEINVCMFITNNQANDHTRPMATVEVEENGTLWFFTDIRSIKVEEVNRNHTVHLVYAHPGKESYMDVWGEASVVTDIQSKKDKWTPFIKAWFPDGVNNPNLALLKVQPQDVYYWDAEAGRMVSFLKIIAGAITGKPALSSDAQGSIKV
jgi:general stress protein 26